MDAAGHFRSKKITLMGLGLLGRGVGDAEYLAACGAELIVTDLKSKEQLADSLARLEKFKNIAYVLGEHRLEDFDGRDLIIKAAGVPLDSPYIAEAKKHRIPVRMSADLFMEYAGIECVGVTGTRGKSTVSAMIAAILKEAGREVVLGGNVRGVSTLALLEEVKGGEIAVLELDSWQCQGLKEAGLSPHIAVFTTFYPDHLNYYKGDLDAYLADKANIFLYQRPEDTLVLGQQCAAFVREKYGASIKSRIVEASERDVPAEWELTIPGAHNRYDAACALAAARAAGIADDVSREALESFKGVPGRLELVREINGVKIYNDTNSTTPEATIAALAALDPHGERKIVLIMGGADKGLDMSALREAVHAHAKDVVFLAGSGTERIKGDAPDKPVFGSLEEALAAAQSAAVPGDTILFSPAFASFGMFRNEYDRGDQFNALVAAL
ncbi:MAG TPA: UDP-N-acetylmuramoyl-L-alanine--D-glutamate ligase [Candidatus Paceibacterota bacterium]|nr:UDP-N-acetylmuramoyl-L-alanine--D-glutamate ligase [Candidatus Paceibacterota bacterium]